MKRYFLLFLFADISYIGFSQTTAPANEETVNQMAVEMCEAMEMKNNNPTPEASDKIIQIYKKYESVSEEELWEVMKKRCPSVVQKTEQKREG
ncbi:MAG: hypothetical protein K2X86_08565 [Cytophagaceae bacterium]|nr:hypothetical protein [Cytophagaceae bacterium]